MKRSLLLTVLGLGLLAVTPAAQAQQDPGPRSVPPPPEDASPA